MTALSGLAGGEDAQEGGELGGWSPDSVAEEPTALSLPWRPPLVPPPPPPPVNKNVLWISKSVFFSIESFIAFPTLFQ